MLRYPIEMSVLSELLDSENEMICTSLGLSLFQGVLRVYGFLGKVNGGHYWLLVGADRGGTLH
jgi:hypothetical protein